MRQVPCRDSLVNVFALAFNAQFGFHLLSPLLAFIFFATNSPLFSLSTNLSKRSFFYGLCLGLASIGSLIANIAIPIISDYYGRKSAWYISMSALFAVAICSLGAILWQNPLLFILGFFLHGLLDANKSTGLASVCDISPKHNLVSNMGTLQCLIAAGACAGPILGGFIAEKNTWINIPYSLPFLLSLSIGIISMGLAYQYKEHSSPQPTKFNFKTITNHYLNLIRQPEIQKLLIILILSQLSWSTYYQFIGPLLKNQFNFSPQQIGIFIGSIAFWLVLAAGIVLRFIMQFFNSQQIIRGSIISVAFGTTMTLISTMTSQWMISKFLLWFSAIPIAMGDVILYSLLVSLFSQKVDPNHHGKSMGLNLIVAMLTWSTTAFLGGYLISLSPLGALYFMPIGIFIALILSQKNSLFTLDSNNTHLIKNYAE